MKTKIRVAGGKYDSKDNVIWEGEMPLVEPNGLRIVDESNEDKVCVYYVSQVAFHVNKEMSWQTVFVVPVKQ